MRSMSITRLRIKFGRPGSRIQAAFLGKGAAMATEADSSRSTLGRKNQRSRRVSLGELVHMIAWELFLGSRICDQHRGTGWVMLLRGDDPSPWKEPYKRLPQ